MIFESKFRLDLIFKRSGRLVFLIFRGRLEDMRLIERVTFMGRVTDLLRMKRAIEMFCDWEACNADECRGCGPSERLKTLITARPLCHVQLDVQGTDATCFLYDCSDLYPDTQTLLEPRLTAISKCE